MNDSPLSGLCQTNAILTGDSFVGIRATSNGLEINFPTGFALSTSDATTRTDILDLISVLSDMSSFEGFSAASGSAGSSDSSLAFPFSSFLEVISDFYRRGGLIRRFETASAVSSRGKIDWRRTVKHQRPHYLADTGFLYSSFVVNRRFLDDSSLVSLIHHWCLYISFSRAGWLFNDFVPPRPSLPFHQQRFVNELSSLLSNTFNDLDRRLFLAMLAVVTSYSDDDGADFPLLGTDKFEFVWERLIDSAFGTVPSKASFFPRSEWRLSGSAVSRNAPLQPDSVMVLGDSIFVLDAKYYRFGATGYAGHLPGSSDINKQIAYGDFAAKLYPDRKVYSAFLIPADLSKENGVSFLNAGKAVAEWRAGGPQTHDQVQAILVDTKSIIASHRLHHEVDRTVLAATILRGFS